MTRPTAAVTFSEDFSALDYADLTNTTAEWNTEHGEGSLAKKFQPTKKSVLDTSGTAFEVVVDGSYAYIADGTAGVKIVDISNLASPTLVATYSASNENIIALDKTGNYIVAANANEANSIDVEIIDVSTPSSPTRLTSISVNAGFADGADVLVDGTELYILFDVHPSSAAFDQIYSYNISTISSPTQLDSINIPQSGNLRPDGLFVAGDRLYVGVYTAGVSVVNIANPSDLLSVDDFDLGTPGVTDVIYKDNYIWASASDDNIYVLDATTESSLSLATTFALYDTANGLTLSGNTVYASAEGGWDVITLNISTASSPSYLQNHYEYQSATHVYDTYLAGSTLYAAMGAQGLLILDYTAPLSPAQNWQYNTSSSTVPARDFEVAGSYGYLADTGIHIFDISTPSSPVFKGSYTSSCSEAWDVEVSGSYAFMACTGGGVRVYNISSPTSPTLSTTITTSGNSPRGLKLVGNTLYVANGASGFAIYDVSNPLSATLTGSVNTAGTASGVDVQGSYAYVADFYEGVVVINITNPASPTITSTYDPGGSAHVAVQAEGTTLYSASLDNLYLLNITNVSSISVTGSFAALDDGIRKFSLNGNYIYTADSFSGIDLYDITTKSSPSYIGSMDFTDTHASYGTMGVYQMGSTIFSYGYGDPAVFSSGITTQTSSILQSIAVDSSSDTIAHATLTASASTPTSTGITYQLSADGGSTWATVSSGTEHNFTAVGSDLRWKATLTTSDTSKTPTLDSISIAYEGYRVPSAPTVTVSSATTQPTFATSSYSSDLTHSSTVWEIYDSATVSSGSLVATSGSTSDNKTQITVSGNTFTFQNDLADRDLLRPGTAYWVRAQHANSVGSSDWSGMTSFTTSNRSPETTSISAISWNEDSSYSSLDLDSYFSDPDALTLSYSASSSDSPDNIDITIDETTHIVTFRPDDNWYGTDTLTFTASDGVNQTSSNSLTLTVNNVNDAPGKPTGFTVTDGTAFTTDTPTFSWTAATDIDNNSSDLHYDIRIGTSKDDLSQNYDVATSTATNETTLILTQALADKTTHYYIVRAVDPSDAASGWSDPLSFSIQKGTSASVTVSKTSEVVNSSASSEYNWGSFLAGHFFLNARAADSFGPSTSLWLEIIHHPFLTYFFLSVTALSFFSVVFITKKLRLVWVYLFSPAPHSFARIASRKKDGTWKISYQSYKNKSRVHRGLFLSSTFLLLLKIVISSYFASFLLGDALPTQGASGSNIVYPGQSLRYTLTYTNKGSGAATNLKITDTFDTATSFVKDSITYGDGSNVGLSDSQIFLSENNLTFTIPVVPQKNVKGYTDSISFLVTVDEQIPGDVSALENSGNFTHDSSKTSTSITPVQNSLPSSYVGGSVYLDTNDNGIKDDGEGGIASATVILYKDSDTSKDFSTNYDELLQKTTTDAGGGYTFYHTPEGVYFIELSTSSLTLESPVIRPNNPRSATVYEDNGFKSTGFDFFAASHSAPATEETEEIETTSPTPQSTESDDEGEEVESGTDEQDASEEDEASRTNQDKNSAVATGVCAELSLVSIDGQGGQLDQFTVSGQQNVTLTGSTCANEKLLASYRDQDVVVIAGSDGSWSYTVAGKDITNNSSIVFQLVRNTDVSITVKLFLMETTPIEKISTFVNQDVGIFIQDLDQNLMETTGLNLKIMISILILLLFFWLAYRLLLQKYFQKKDKTQ